MEMIIRGRRIVAPTFAELSSVYCRIRDASGEGGSTFGPAIIRNDSGVAVAYISYNGRVWPGSPQEWSADRVCLYSPYETEAA